MESVEKYVVILIYVLQVLSFFSTFIRIVGFSKIFGGGFWQIFCNGFIGGILDKIGIRKKSFEYKLNYRTTEGKNGVKDKPYFEVASGDNGNNYFKTIKNSINNYVQTNDVVDFQLIKDTVDGNCSAIEEDIQTQIPMPLYMGLAGTMLGVVVGVMSLLDSGDFSVLISAAAGSGADASVGITSLLSSVGNAMKCSFVGLLCTTLLTWIFKGCKLSNEGKKNKLLAWLQQNLLSKVDTTDVEAINRIANSLGDFNKSFKQQFQEFNESFAYQSEVVTSSLVDVQKMIDKQKELAHTVEKISDQAVVMSEANKAATAELANSADRIKTFNKYLQKVDQLTADIEGFVAKMTSSVESFVTKLAAEENRVKAMEEIMAFFRDERNSIKARNERIASEVGKMDRTSTEAIRQLQDHMRDESKELNKISAERTRTFKNAIEEQQQILVKANAEIINGLQDQFKQLPEAVGAINGLKDLPGEIAKLLAKIEESNKRIIEKVEASNTKLVNSVNESQTKAQNQVKELIKNGGNVSAPESLTFPSWLKYSVLAVLIIITFSCVFSSYNTWKMNQKIAEIPEQVSAVVPQIATATTQQMISAISSATSNSGDEVAVEEKDSSKCDAKVKSDTTKKNNAKSVGGENQTSKTKDKQKSNKSTKKQDSKDSAPTETQTSKEESKTESSTSQQE